MLTAHLSLRQEQRVTGSLTWRVWGFSGRRPDLVQELGRKSGSRCPRTESSGGTGNVCGLVHSRGGGIPQSHVM